jgi:plasmid stability protein
MAKMIQIRNVPEDLHRELKARAALAGQSLSDYLLTLIRRASDQATPDEMRAILERSEAVELDRSSADVIRDMRGPLTMVSP